MSDERDHGVYMATLYHDSEGEASDDSYDIGAFRTLEDAVEAIAKDIDPARGWFTGGVRHGILHVLVPGTSPEWFEPDGSAWHVGPDGVAQ